MTVNIVDLVRADGIELSRVAATHGGEYCGPCPRCSGHDRFCAWPQMPNSKGGRYWCRGCGLSGDAIEYLKTFRQMRFKEACDYLGFEVTTISHHMSGHKLSAHKSKPKWEPKEIQTPSDQWQSKARNYLEGAVCNLWAAAGQRWLGWLKEIRGLKEATIRASNLGLQPIDRWESRESWGLEPVLKDNGQTKKLWLPEGLVIPYFVGDQISQISFRRKKSAGAPRYVHLAGSHTHPMVLYPERDIWIVVESALDGFLLGQEAGDLAGVVILASAQVQPDKDLVALLRRRRLILIALDADAAGVKNHRWWADQFPNAKRLPPIRGKDPGEMLEKGINMRLWVKVGIARFLDGVTEPEKEENELPSSGNGHSAEPQPPNNNSLPHQDAGGTLSPRKGPPSLAGAEEKPIIDEHHETAPPSTPVIFPAVPATISLDLLENKLTCFDCLMHEHDPINSPEGWGRCLKRNRGRFGCATACEAAITDDGAGPDELSDREIRHLRER